jgi:hypothetical protein
MDLVTHDRCFLVTHAQSQPAFRDLTPVDVI